MGGEWLSAPKNLRVRFQHLKLVLFISRTKKASSARSRDTRVLVFYQRIYSAFKTTPWDKWAPEKVMYCTVQKNVRQSESLRCISLVASFIAISIVSGLYWHQNDCTACPALWMAQEFEKSSKRLVHSRTQWSEKTLVIRMSSEHHQCGFGGAGANHSSYTNKKKPVLKDDKYLSKRIVDSFHYFKFYYKKIALLKLIVSCTLHV